MPPAKALIRLRVCAGWSEPLLVAHTTLLEISCQGSNLYWNFSKNLQLLLFSSNSLYVFVSTSDVWNFLEVHCHKLERFFCSEVMGFGHITLKVKKNYTGVTGQNIILLIQFSVTQVIT